ncbi:hypothetical protein [Rhizobium sp. TRM95796]|uniref:hypothetical protein n=1 Tax=Rhizobium sp. TRM95796 TaxID=2979862 RepID=UPI0021E82D3B|nr:hypothetical protein [Rhizobium sp. TRM95796]MCV3768897.1 hypothetical protein [Rhizobium sp. TRM95796]
MNAVATVVGATTHARRKRLADEFLKHSVETISGVVIQASVGNADMQPAARGGQLSDADGGKIALDSDVHFGD